MNNANQINVSSEKLEAYDIIKARMEKKKFAAGKSPIAKQLEEDLRLMKGVADREGGWHVKPKESEWFDCFGEG